jgi:hypothetical protein
VAVPGVLAWRVDAQLAHQVLQHATIVLPMARQVLRPPLLAALAQQAPAGKASKSCIEQVPGGSDRLRRFHLGVSSFSVQ